MTISAVELTSGALTDCFDQSPSVGKTTVLPEKQLIKTINQQQQHFTALLESAQPPSSRLLDPQTMLALLMINRISAQKVDEPGGLLKIKVVEADFVNAVEILRQNGYPKRQFFSVNDLFPANQLVTSPLQEQAKLTYLKEQRLEQLISAMEGVVSASISIADPPQAENRREVIPPSASVLVKYSPETNMAHFINQIKSLVHNSVPGLGYEAITVVLQATNYRFLQQQIPEILSVKSLTTSSMATDVSTLLSPWFEHPPLAKVLAWSAANPLWCLLGATWLVVLLLGGYWLSRRRTATGYANH